MKNRPNPTLPYTSLACPRTARRMRDEISLGKIMNDCRTHTRGNARSSVTLWWIGAAASSGASA